MLENKGLRKVCEPKKDEISSRLSGGWEWLSVMSILGSGISSVESLGSTTRELLSSLLILAKASG
jgi:hypothetical protein